MAFDREKLESLNADHHRRMAQAPSTGNSSLRDLASRAKLIEAVRGCRLRHCMEWTVDLMSGTLPHILELGAGYAGDRETLVKEFYGIYTGIEAVKHVADASAATVDLSRGDSIHHMAIEELPHEWGGKFQLVYSRHVMEHVLDVDLALANIKRVLSPNGIVAAITPHYFPDPEPSHVTQLRIEDWMSAYRRAGLKPVYASLESFACEEAHLLCVHNEYELQP